MRKEGSIFIKIQFEIDGDKVTQGTRSDICRLESFC